MPFSFLKYLDFFLFPWNTYDSKFFFSHFYVVRCLSQDKLEEVSGVSVDRSIPTRYMHCNVHSTIWHICNKPYKSWTFKIFCLSRTKLYRNRVYQSIWQRCSTECESVSVVQRTIVFTDCKILQALNKVRHIWSSVLTSACVAATLARSFSDLTRHHWIAPLYFSRLIKHLAWCWFTLHYLYYVHS